MQVNKDTDRMCVQEWEKEEHTCPMDIVWFSEVAVNPVEDV